jgi:regulator of protease activity HflC (stomatin/prohibitin superfamily)
MDMKKFFIIIVLVAVNVNLFAQKKIKYQGEEYSLAIQRNELDMTALVKDRFPVILKMTVLTHFKEEDIPKIHEQLGAKYAVSIQESIINNAARIVFGKYTLEELLVIKRELFENELSIHIEKEFSKYNIQLNSILIEQILPSPNIGKILEEKYIALQENERQKYLMEVEKKKLEIQKMQADAEAERNLLINKSLTEKVLQLKYIEALQKLAESENAKVVIISDKKISIPELLKEE